MEIKVFYAIGNARVGQLKSAVRILNCFQNYYYFQLNETERDVVDTQFVDWDQFDMNQSSDNGHSVYITEKPFSDNWFSHGSASFSIITMHDWEIYFSPPSLKAYLVYQIAQAALCFEADFHEGIEFNMVHFDANGCIFDMCQHKNDIKIGMIAGSICPVCRSTLQRYGVRDEAIVAIEHILQYVRSEAIGKPIIMDYNRAFIVMRFSSHDENDNAYLYGIKTALEELGIEPYRADNKVLSAQLLDQIKAEIMKSRFVIAKIDSENLNVFFELGFAMGKEKDVLLISEESLIMNLPTDLKNWECLTYPKGDYATLKYNVIKFFRDNYHI